MRSLPETESAIATPYCVTESTAVPLMNPVVLERTLETQGENLVKGMARLAADLERGQLTHTDTSKFKLGENIACTPGKVIHETPLYQLIQYTPTTEEVLDTVMPRPAGIACAAVTVATVALRRVALSEDALS
mgnify:CR=1 FL=1